MIDTDEQIDWLFNKFHSSNDMKPRYKKWKMQKQKMIDDGLLPKALDEQIAFTGKIASKEAIVEEEGSD